MAKTVKSISEPWKEQQPGLTFGFDQARSLYDNPFFQQMFPYSTAAPFSPPQVQGLQQIVNTANSRQPDVNTYARQEAGKTLQGNYLSADSNPYLQAMYGQAKRDFVTPVNMAAEGMGRTGSGLHAQAAADALIAAQDASYGQHYDNERQHMMQMMGMAPQIADTAYADPRMLLAAGEQIQQQGQNQINDQFQRFNYSQSRPWDLLNNYMGIVGGNQYGGATSERTSANPWSQVLGGALGGAQLLNLLPGYGTGSSSDNLLSSIGNSLWGS